MDLRPGLLLVHKPEGPTSATLVRALAAPAERRPPMCHAGTLDPFASGLLVLAVGQATRIVHLLHDVPKEYEAIVVWGAETDNGDPLGRVIATGETSDLDPARLDAAIAQHVGWRAQVPPATSAKRVGGEYAYAKAHRGEVFELPAVKVFLHEARWLSHQLEEKSSRLFLRCGRGYYVRSLVRDLGRALGCGAHVAALHRSRIGPWADPGPDRRVEIEGAALLPWLPARPLDEGEARRVSQGQTIDAGAISSPPWTVPAGFPEPDPPVRGLHRDRLVALLRWTADGRLAPFANLRGGL